MRKFQLNERAHPGAKRVNTEFEQNLASLQYQTKRAVSYEYFFIAITAAVLASEAIRAVSRHEISRPAILLGLIFTTFSAVQGLRFLKARQARIESDLHALRDVIVEFADEKRRFQRLWLAGLVPDLGVHHSGGAGT